jgi:hypothetical protein
MSLGEEGETNMYVVEGGKGKMSSVNPTSLRARLAWISEARAVAASARELERAKKHPELFLSLPHQRQKKTSR